MNLMKKLFEQFEEEVEGVKEYTKCSMETKDDASLSKMYMEMAQAELQHAQVLQAQIVKQATSHTPTSEEAVKILEELWKEKQEKMNEELAEAKAYMDISK